MLVSECVGELVSGWIGGWGREGNEGGNIQSVSMLMCRC